MLTLSRRSVTALAASLDLRSEPLEALEREEIKPARPRVIIVGAGFAGPSAAKELARTAVDVTVIDRRNYHQDLNATYTVSFLNSISVTGN